jgi:hypothetical protein
MGETAHEILRVFVRVSSAPFATNLSSGKYLEQSRSEWWGGRFISNTLFRKFHVILV